MSSRRRILIASAAAISLIAPLAWMWQDSLLPSSYSVMEMGYPDYGGGQQDHHHAMGGTATGRTVDSLAERSDRRTDVLVTLVARKEKFRLASGVEVDGYTLNGTSPGPMIRAEQGELIEVRLVNESVPDAVALHWHGVDVPNSQDGVAGVTQDAVRTGSEFTYRFAAEQAGTYWYHSHQVSHEQVQRGLFGALVITPKHHSDSDAATDVTALLHLYGGHRTVNGRTGAVAVASRPGSRVRVRVINTDNGPTPIWVGGAGYRVVAIDGTDVHRPTPITDTSVLVTAGGRVDLELAMPADGRGVRVELGGSAALVLGAPSQRSPRPERLLDLLSYGSPAPIGFDVDAADRRFEYSIGRRPGFVDGLPGMWWTINGHLFPDVPMFVVADGDVVRMRVTNTSGEVHPMHLHGHHAVVLSRDGVQASGSPWWVDSLNVADGESYDIAFLADNPGIWMDHCHNLPHAAEGLVAHLIYEGVRVPYRIGSDSGNEPE